MAEAHKIIRPKRGVRGDYRHFQSLTTRWMDNDIYGHLNNVVHYSLFDSAVNAWLLENGLLDFEGPGPIGVVVESGCRYHAELAFPKPVVAGLRIAHIGNSSVRYEIGLFSGEEDLAAAEGFMVHVFIDRISRAPIHLDSRAKTMLASLHRDSPLP